MISSKQVQDSIQKYDKFDENPTPQLLMLPTGMIYLYNKAYKEKFPDHDIVGYKIFKFFSKNGAFLNDFTFNINNENVY